MGKITLSNNFCQDLDAALLSVSSPAWVPSAEAGEAPKGGASLPSLYSNNTIEKPLEDLREDQILALCGILSPHHKRQAETLFLNVSRLSSLAPSLGHLGFLTLTTKDNCTDAAEFYRRWNSFRTNYLSKSPYFGQYIGVFERQKRGAWHLHLLIVLSDDIRTGVDFEAFEKGHYRTSPPYLRALWRELRAKLVLYGFGRHELLPVRSNAEGMARYMGKYISKHLGARKEEDKGKRLVTYSKDWVKNSSRFAWNTDGAKEWRRKLEKFARLIGCQDLDDIYGKLGPGWAYKHIDSIYDIDEFALHLNEGVPF